MIAIIGIGGLFPRARSTRSFWSAICTGADCISRFARDELEGGQSAFEPRHGQTLVQARGWFDDPDGFDAEFFGYSEAEAWFIDPQQRLFLQEAWRLLEATGYRPNNVPGRVGVFAGCGMNAHLIMDVMSTSNVFLDDDLMPKITGNEKDFLAARISHKLGLTGPSVNVQTACSTSLAAVHLGCQCLAAGDCDVVIAGGASVVPHKVGYFAQEGGILSPDGICSPFDARANGFVPGNGVALVCLKRLEDAMTDGDRVRAVIRGTAMNNDGARKAGFAAPSEAAQIECISEALAISEAPAGSIGYIEAHGTGTALGDPIEFAALQKAYKGFNAETGCVLGALKANFGHMDTAAGAAALIKAVLVTESGCIPPLANFRQPNPALDLSNGRIWLPKSSMSWQCRQSERWAGVNSLGLGGSNVHVVLSGPPEVSQQFAPWRARLVPLSARSPALLGTYANELAQSLDCTPAPLPEDVAFTLAHGRYPHRWRYAAVMRETNDLARQLTGGIRAIKAAQRAPVIAFVFPGGGSQHARMAIGLRENEPVFARAYDECAELFRDRHRISVGETVTANGESLRSPVRGLAELFAVEYALIQLWSHWGVRPDLLVGHSAGEYAAAVASGMLSLESAVALVAERGRLMTEMPQGGMLSVNLGADEVERFLGPRVSLAASNSPALSTLAAAKADLHTLVERFEAEGIPYRPLHIEVAAHSHLVDSVLSKFAEKASRIAMKPPTIPIASCLTGQWLNSETAPAWDYWLQHFRKPVRFSEATTLALDAGVTLFVELGPGQSLTSILNHRFGPHGAAVALPSLPAADHIQNDHATTLAAAAEAWSHGADIDWGALVPRGRRIDLPASPLDSRAPLPPSRVGATPIQVTPRGREWVQSWAPEPLGARRPIEGTVLIFGHETIAKTVANLMERRSIKTYCVESGRSFGRKGDNFVLNPGSLGDISTLLEHIDSIGNVLHLWGLEDADNRCNVDEVFARGASCLLNLHRAIKASGRPEVTRLTICVKGCTELSTVGAAAPLHAATLGFAHGLSRELLSTSVVGVDLDAELVSGDPKRTAAVLIEEMEAAQRMRSALIVRCGSKRWIRSYRSLHEAVLDQPTPEVHTILITGGFGGLALEVARHYAERGATRIALLGRELPGPDHPVAARIGALKAMGVELMTLACDVADASRLKEAVVTVQAHFGDLDLVLHAAGRRAGGLVELKETEELCRVMAPKVRGALALVDALRTNPPKRLVFFSALDAHLGTPGLSDHVAANAFLDAYVSFATARLSPASVVSIAWQAWSETGQAATTLLPDEIVSLRARSLMNGLSTAEGLRQLDRCLNAEHCVVIVFGGDLLAEISDMETLTERSFVRSRKRVAIEDLSTQFESPATEMESLICEVFQQVLGIPKVGATDDFFVLGGHSLLGLSLMSRLQGLFEIRLPLATLIKARTSRDLASVIEAALIDQAPDEVQR